ncbi:hypothetical protein MKK88_14920 [Methylobacterium sp. E-005]|uniref:hypothetical protein n=1 Tax=Methylobacterium sp. E-005 TaxID=2836549 RepID=UPI001FBA16A1|nr:hypothetical protein [Methylobacterium sp. E-005]MCJ2087267.1 hypothetical protein [Methylobacterium sp. E-005]
MSAGTSGNGDGQNVGQLPLTGQNSPLNQHAFLHRQIQGEQRTHFAAEIVAVHNRNSMTKPCTVDIRPVLSDVDGLGQAQKPAVIYGIPVPRNQSGDSVVINDPSVGDRAHFSVFDRDHSSSQASDWQAGNPGSFRRSTMADAIFHAVLPREAQEVKQFIRFDDGDGGITQQDRHGNSLVSNKADGWNLNGVKIDSKGNITSPGNMTAGKGTADQVDLQGHAHGNSGPPTAGT